MPVIFEYIAIYSAGGMMYSAVEVAYRGYTHWTMFAAGGACFVILYIIEKLFTMPFWKK